MQHERRLDPSRDSRSPPEFLQPAFTYPREPVFRRDSELVILSELIWIDKVDAPESSAQHVQWLSLVPAAVGVGREAVAAVASEYLELLRELHSEPDHRFGSLARMLDRQDEAQESWVKGPRMVEVQRSVGAIADLDSALEDEAIVVPLGVGYLEPPVELLEGAWDDPLVPHSAVHVETSDPVADQRQCGLVEMANAFGVVEDSPVIEHRE